ncbi:hypothetical protein SO802_017619 [Lithocarpus litseifolius]|uniref:Myb-like domain-containing protein n=1 Tax=Lithocarpus litseifolius TaxID=425828 RepID=A0AAW2CIV7_9ROSI
MVLEFHELEYHGKLDFTKHDASDMDDFPKVLCGWSWEENKLFKLALAVADEEDPDRWEMVAAIVGGKKSAEDMQKWL